MRHIMETSADITELAAALADAQLQRALGNVRAGFIDISALPARLAAASAPWCYAAIARRLRAAVGGGPTSTATEQAELKDRLSPGDELLGAMLAGVRQAGPRDRWKSGHIVAPPSAGNRRFGRPVADRAGGAAPAPAQGRRVDGFPPRSIGPSLGPA